MCLYKYRYFLIRSIEQVKINMERFNVHLNDLPDEILVMILKQMSNVEILYSLSNVNQRLSTIAHDPIFTSHLIFSNHHSNNFLSTLSISVLDRFFLEIFPKIHDKVQWLDLAGPYIERILLFPKFPKLYQLGLFDLEIEYAKYLFIGKLFSLNYCKVASLFDKNLCGLLNVILFRRKISDS